MEGRARPGWAAEGRLTGLETAPVATAGGGGVRLQKIEGEYRGRSEECVRKDRTIKKLERQVRELEGKLELKQSQKGEGAGAASEEIAQARASEKRAWDQVDQLKAALGEAGMVWLGDGAAPAHALGEAPEGGGKAAGREGASPPHTPPRQDKEVGPSQAEQKSPPAAREREELNPMDLDMILLKDRISELNTIAGDGVGSVGNGPRKERVIQMKQPARLILFKDGLKLHDNPFCSYADAEAVRTLKDVYDGYFPKALQKSFPEGVPIKLEDRRRESYRAATTAEVSRPLSNVKGFSSIGDENPAPQSKKDLLGKLPQSVIRNGKIIEVRSGVSAAMGSTSPDKALVNTAVDSLLSQSTRFSMGPSCRAPPSTTTAGDGASSEGGEVEVTTLQVKSEDGSETYVLRLKYGDTIGDVRLALNRHRRAAAGRPAAKYEIQSGFPPRTFGDSHETLRDAGLVPNATLFLRGPGSGRR